MVLMTKSTKSKLKLPGFLLFQESQLHASQNIIENLLSEINIIFNKLSNYTKILNSRILFSHQSITEFLMAKSLRM